ncbi:hypothetical protein GR211_33405 [Rhizobium leguminosarum]|uniref:hypothetical protein n=2 Tax=Rhizobium TaxID=379 RepID=UPI0013B9693D|nr:hypothetical protein [Rhizobium ruizarguesonis]NEJ17746.1 hypothetical protein [Rhizobium ruizarguesonis]NEK31724.1 hypothetical protein [Rhizobium ruizarguesonis]
MISVIAVIKYGKLPYQLSWPDFSMTVILTACTMRKRFSPDVLLNARAITAGTTHSVGEDWRDRVRRAEPQVSASDLYAGRSMAEAKTAARAIGAKLTIASAGLGLVPAEKKIPSYNLTVSPGSADSILRKLPPEASAYDWWLEVFSSRQAEAVSEVLQGNSQALLLVSLPHSYLLMLTPLLISLSTANAGRLRIMTASAKVDLVPILRPFLLPYDERLDGPDSPIPGTIGDYASRALRHFVTNVLINNPDGNIADHTDAVRSRLLDWRFPERKAGKRVSDQEVLKLLRDNWAMANGRSTKLLRMFRDEMNIACEQGRFARLAAIVRNEVAGR